MTQTANKNLLFVYGTIAQEAVQVRVLGRLCPLTEACLEGYKVRQGKWPYLVPQEGNVAHGWLIADLSDADIAKLDAYEQVEDEEIYTRERVNVRCPDQSVASCWAYIPILNRWRHEWLAEGGNG